MCGGSLHFQFILRDNAVSFENAVICLTVKAKLITPHQRQIKQKKLSIDDVKELTWTRILELSALEQKKIYCRRQLYMHLRSSLCKWEKAVLKRFLLTRATKVLDLLKQKHRNFFSRNPQTYEYGLSGLFLFVLHFCLASLLMNWQRPATKSTYCLPSSRLVLWNILIYIWLMVSFIVRCVRKEKDLRSRTF